MAINANLVAISAACLGAACLYFSLYFSAVKFDTTFSHSSFVKVVNVTKGGQPTFPSYKHGSWIFHPLPEADYNGSGTNINICCNNVGQAYDSSKGAVFTNKNCVDARSDSSVITKGKIAFGIGNYCLCSSYQNATVHNETLPGNWTWVPHSARDRVSPFSASKLCTQLGNRDLLLVGDSTQQQTWTVLANKLGSSNARCMGQLKYFASDVLAPTRSLWRGAFDRGKSLEHWLQPYISGNKSAVVVVCVAAHLNDVWKYKQVLEWVRTFVRAQAGLVRTRNHPDGRISIFFKTSNPPQFGCKTYTRPLLSKEFNEKSNNNAKHGYWKQALQYDKIGVSMLQKHISGIIDMTPLYLRPDAHSFDCLHYCLNTKTGSPLDLFATQLNAALSQQLSSMV